MGEISDAMLSGLVCQCCGVVIDYDEPGYPRYCDDCADDDGIEDEE